MKLSLNARARIVAESYLGTVSIAQIKSCAREMRLADAWECVSNAVCMSTLHCSVRRAQEWA